ncbi:short chain dehydrogenase [Devosia insulae DS-56]|uniref:Short chain dehydrogenase n=1 Tax=Devosia insulae DS-56 TaxID=1116389 RepID=A0A1E5XUQ3_9HYPH|nr:SDR family oxidoreductase [Devosia insulae]OEO32319.1 short chain dehydrogenase [Devosia insulae DS-56]
MSWSTKDIPDQSGKLALITGATGGLGYETALALARANADVVLTGRSADKGAAALARIRAEIPRAKVSYESLDLAALANVAAFTERFAKAHDHLDILVNNAGVMALPARQVTVDGFEQQFGTNYLSHFALTARLLPLLARAKAPVTVQLSSGYAHSGRIDFDDLQGERLYRPFKAYGQSKLAMLMFALELQRHSDRAGWNLKSTAAHPGYARTELIPNGPGTTGLSGLAMRILSPLMSQTPAEGALPQLFAATSPAAVPGGYYSPSHRFELVGPPKDGRFPAHAKDQAVAARLWTVSEQLTGTRFPALAALPA